MEVCCLTQVSASLSTTTTTFIEFCFPFQHGSSLLFPLLATDLVLDVWVYILIKAKVKDLVRGCELEWETAIWGRTLTLTLHTSTHTHTAHSHCTHTCMYTHTLHTSARTHTAHAHCTLTLRTHTAHAHCTLTLHTHTAHTCMYTLYTHTAHSHCTLTLHPHTAPSHCTLTLHTPVPAGHHDGLPRVVQ